MTGSARSAPESFRGATALAAAFSVAPSRQPGAPPVEPPPTQRAQVPRQIRLFAESDVKVLRFPLSPKPAEHRTTPRTRTRRHSPQLSDSQAFLDFLPPAPHVPRTLKTSVEAVIYCDSPVATPTHRAVAFAIDFALVVMAISVFVVTFSLCGGQFEKMNLGVELGFAGAFACVALFYGILAALTGAESPGARAVGLRFINFDGSPIDRRERTLRFGCACLSFLAAGLGVLWALADEESLTWHDHMSKTFPTVRT